MAALRPLMLPCRTHSEALTLNGLVAIGAMGTTRVMGQNVVRERSKIAW